MAFDESGKIWFNGEFVDWNEAKIHALSHVVHYGSSVFEGIRCYDTKKGPAVFRLAEHVKRLYNSAKIYRMEIPYSPEDFCQAVLDTIKVNELKACYIRPIIFRGYAELGVYPLNCAVESLIAVWAWGKYLGEEALENGVDVGVSTWRRMAPNTMPNMAKAGSNYMNSQLAKMEAVANGYDEAIMLDYQGLVSEGSGENVFLVKDEILYTPPRSSSLLDGITRNSIITLAREMDLEVKEEEIPREMLYIADELFLTGTAAEVSPIRSVDRITVGNGKRGEITKKLQEQFFAIIDGETDDTHGWLTFL
ncbi:MULTISPECIES: branched-chain-amino-acid transaminase [Methanobacterium]|uniref:Branched-chain-amino-acid aminotransferase n=1 Tax=Methanobacterium formicicum TaxID=2162 RepID=A0A090JVY2_METFO|nr:MULTISPECIES: branched-chain-amino-acid transaminase [Methanobacterium]KUK75224.1 MAG: Branched-chain amino acid aminotransferase [Methanobacterium sp. 42_16]MDH2659572.1 branched-chain-amino-acid transaminase [Methanobacterium formicicum]CEA13671.1 putative branched-chain-amino-acid aminotransferase [Methanobacterium formicicum]